MDGVSYIVSYIVSYEYPQWMVVNQWMETIGNPIHRLSEPRLQPLGPALWHRQLGPLGLTGDTSMVWGKGTTRCGKPISHDGSMVLLPSGYVKIAIENGHRNTLPGANVSQATVSGIN